MLRIRIVREDRVQGICLAIPAASGSLMKMQIADLIYKNRVAFVRYDHAPKKGNVFWGPK